MRMSMSQLGDISQKAWMDYRREKDNFSK